MFALLMAVDMIVFGMMCYSYVYITHSPLEYLDIGRDDTTHDGETLVGGEHAEEMDTDNPPQHDKTL